MINVLSHFGRSHQSGPLSPLTPPSVFYGQHLSVFDDKIPKFESVFVSHRTKGTSGLFIDREVKTSFASYTEKERGNLDRDLKMPGLCLETYGLLMAITVDRSYLSHAFPCTEESIPAICPC